MVPLYYQSTQKSTSPVRPIWKLKKVHNTLRFTKWVLCLQILNIINTHPINDNNDSNTSQAASTKKPPGCVTNKWGGVRAAGARAAPGWSFPHLSPLPNPPHLSRKRNLIQSNPIQLNRFFNGVIEREVFHSKEYNIASIPNPRALG